MAGERMAGNARKSAESEATSRSALPIFSISVILIGSANERGTPRGIRPAVANSSVDHGPGICYGA
jgi:hypothetical protein